MYISSKQGLFSGNPSNKYQVDKDGLRKLTVEQLAKGLQSRPGNEVAGLEGRAQLLIRLGDALAEKTDFFGETARPGNMIGGLTSLFIQLIPLPPPIPPYSLILRLYTQQ